MSYRNCEGEAPQDGNVKTQLSELENLQVLFHVTNANVRFSILQAGFLDGRGSYMTDAVLEGVWLSDEPLSQNEGAWGDHILEVAFPESIDLSEERSDRGR